MKSQKSRSKSVTKGRKEIVPGIPQFNRMIGRTRERMVTTLKEFKSHSSSKSKSKSKGNKQHRRDNSMLSTHAPTLNSDDDNKIELVQGKSTLRKLITNAKELIGTQSCLLKQCTEITKTISNTDLELDSIYNQSYTDNNQFMVTLDKFKSKLEIDTKEKSQLQSQKQEENEDNFQTFIMGEMNSLNEMIGNLGYNYVFHKYKTHNFNHENISEYYANTKKLLKQLNKNEKQSMAVIQEQQQEIHNLKETMKMLQQELMQSSSVSNKMFTPRHNNNRPKEEEEVEKNNNCNNSEGMDFMMNIQLKSNSNTTSNNMFERNDKYSRNNDFSYFERNTNEFTSTYNINSKTNVSSSNMFESNTFFEGYKRNKEIQQDLNLEHHYTDGDVAISQSTFMRNDNN